METLVKLSVILLSGIILLAILFYQPFYGMMDDATNLFFLLPKIREQGLLSYSWSYAQNDISWGMFRITYPIMIYFLYGIGASWGATAMFFANALFVLGVLYWNALVLERILKISKWQILLCNLAFFYALDLFQSPSLQEKMVMLFGACLLSISYNHRLSLLSKLVGIIVFALLGIVSKASFCIYLAVSFIALLASFRFYSNKQKIFTATFVAIFYTCAVLFLGWVSSKGVYTTGRYSGQKIFPNLFSIDGLLFLIPVVIFIGFFLRRENIKNRIEIFIPVIGVLAFLAIFLPWGIRAYVQSVVSPLYAALLIFMAHKLLHKWEKCWIPALMGLALAVVCYRSYATFTRLNDIGNVVQMGKELKEKNIHKIYMTCSEGSTMMLHYFTFVAKTEIKVHFLEKFDQLNDKIIFYDSSFCPLPGRKMEVDGCTAEYFYKSPLKRGFRLAKEHCSASKEI